jgi:hypothetical protein
VVGHKYLDRVEVEQLLDLKQEDEESVASPGQRALRSSLRTGSRHTEVHEEISGDSRRLSHLVCVPIVAHG